MHLALKQYRLFIRAAIVLSIIWIVCVFKANAQKQATYEKDTVQIMDIGDVARKIFKKKVDTLKLGKRTGIAILPSFGYNPSFGFTIGAKLSGGKQLGSAENTIYSVFGLEGIYTSKSIINLQLRHNLFTPYNKWNLQGNWQLARYGVVDYGIGTGNSSYRNKGFIFNDYAIKNADSAYPITYKYIRLNEKAYRKVGQYLYAGCGININLYADIEDEKHMNGQSTPHDRYSMRNDFGTEKYSVNGLFLVLQYNTREHPVRSYGGVYADLSFCFNQKWLGSTKNSIQLQYDFRKYWSLSKRNPEHVLALWLWASYKLSGDIPYLALPGTATDTYARSGRGYTLGRFKGPSYTYFETEYRFPIMRNKFLSGVCFFNMQSASDDISKKTFNYWEPGGGLGMRILFQKKSRTTLCIDAAGGKYGSAGIFSGLNEAF